jgi:trigger factor
MPADKDGVKEVQELNNEFIKKLGDFESVSDFKAKLKENIFKEKERHAKEKIRVEIVNKIIHEAVIVLPNILIESELEKMLAQFKDDIAKMNLSFKEYLEKIKKSEDDLRREWGADADKRAKLQLVLNEIAKKENIVVPKEDIQKEVKHLLKHYKGADAKNAELYITSVLTNEKVFKFLENQK